MGRVKRTASTLFENECRWGHDSSMDFEHAAVLDRILNDAAPLRALKKTLALETREIAEITHTPISTLNGYLTARRQLPDWVTYLIISVVDDYRDKMAGGKAPRLTRNEFVPSGYVFDSDGKVVRASN